MSPTILSILMISTFGLAAAIEYPQSRKDDVVDQIHGTPVPDPYRWLIQSHAAAVTGTKSS